MNRFRFRLSLAATAILFLATSLFAETVTIPVPDISIPIPKGFSCAPGTISGGLGVRRRSPTSPGELADELRIEIATPQERNSEEEWKAGREFAAEVAPGYRNLWPDTRCRFYRATIQVEGLREARFAALLPSGKTRVAVFLRGDAKRESLLEKDFRSLFNGQWIPSPEWVSIPVPAIEFHVPAGFERVANPQGALGAWRRGTSPGSPAGDLVLWMHAMKDIPRWRPNWPTNVPLKAATFGDIGFRWMDARKVGFWGAEPPGSMPETRASFLLPIDSVAIEIDFRVDGRNNVSVSLEETGLEFRTRSAEEDSREYASRGVCGGCIRRSPFDGIIGVGLCFGVMFGLFAGLSWLALKVQVFLRYPR